MGRVTNRDPRAASRGGALQAGRRVWRKAVTGRVAEVEDSAVWPGEGLRAEEKAVAGRVLRSKRVGARRVAEAEESQGQACC